MRLAESVRVIPRRAARAEAAPRAMPLPRMQRVALVRVRTTLRGVPAASTPHAIVGLSLKIALCFALARRLGRRPARRDQLVAFLALCAV